MTYDLEALAREQQDIQLSSFDYDVAWRLGLLIREKAAEHSLPIGISVTHGLDTVFQVLMPGATPDNLSWMLRKQAVAHRFHRSSLAMRLEMEAKGRDLNDLFRLPRDSYVASGGGVPLFLRGGTLIGTAAVSGLPDVEDHKMVVAAIRKLIA